LNEFKKLTFAYNSDRREYMGSNPDKSSPPVTLKWTIQQHKTKPAQKLGAQQNFTSDPHHLRRERLVRGQAYGHMT
jgi:hypothetical protein